MIENILSNTTKLISQFWEFKCIFYEFYKFGLCSCAFTGPSANMTDPPVTRPDPPSNVMDSSLVQ